MVKVPAHSLVKELAKKLTPDAATDGERLDALANTPDLPELVLFAGYAGAVVKRPGTQADWQLFYLDPQLFRWMLVNGEAIKHHKEIKDEKLPSGSCDYLWLVTDAQVAHGHGPKTIEQRFLTGEFTRAGDFETPPRGGTYSGTTGVFCEARTPTCCRRVSQGRG